MNKKKIDKKINDNFFINLARNRKTTYEFSDKKINDADINKILEAGRWAPSCTNAQPWQFIIIKNKETIKKLMMTANYGDFHTDPSLIIAPILLEEMCSGKGYVCFRGKMSRVYDSYISIGMVALNMTLQARALGIDSCIVTPTEADAKDILKVRKKDAVPLLVGFGYQKDKAFQKKRERKKLSEITSYEFFS